MRILVTGAEGFLGWHVRCRLHALTGHEVVGVDVAGWAALPGLVAEADAVIHVAGINRADDAALDEGNARLAEELADALDAAGRPIPVAYANSVQAGNGSPYGTGKARAAAVLQRVTATTGGGFADVRLPNLFGEHGRPQYNSFVATFAAEVAAGRVPALADRPLTLLHAQAAAEALIQGLGRQGSVEPSGTPVTVAGVYQRLVEFRRVYQCAGEFPELAGPFDVALFNTFRAALFPGAYPLALTPHSDHRGRLVETVRCHGGPGQTFVSTSRPGVTRGRHFHLRKVERFVVLAGRARIALRRVLTDERVSFDVSGDEPVAVDMPTLWAHEITNTGAEELVTLFWTNELFDPADSDTHPEPVDADQELP